MTRSFRRFVLFFLFAFFLQDLTAQQFKNPMVIQVGGNPRTIAKGDFNRDGKVDLIYIDTVIHVLLGAGDATFKDVQQLPLPTGMGASVTVADVNNDGVQDLLMGDWGALAQIAVFIGNGDGTFKVPIISQIAGANTLWATLTTTFGVVDLDGDGNPDVIASDSQNYTVYVALGDGRGSFIYKSQVTCWSAPGQVFVGDFNSDGKADFLVQGAQAKDVNVYLGNGDATFQPGVQYTSPMNITSIALADVNRDGRVDIVFTGFDNSINVLQGISNGTFAPLPGAGTATGGLYPQLTAALDIDGDGIVDLFTASQNGIGMLLGKSDGTFTGPKLIPAGPFTPTLVVADFNSDGRLDLAVPVPQGIAILLRNSDGSFQTADSYDVGLIAGTAAVANFNNDYHPDIAVAISGHSPKILIGKGDGTFTVTAQSVDAPAGPTVITGDFNADGKQDLFLLDSGGANVQLGNGDGTFSAPSRVSGLSINGFTTASPGDFNRDGKTDLFVINYESFNVLTATSGGNFSVSSTNQPRAFGFVPPAVGDINNDGKLDVIMSTLIPQIYLGNGDGTFTEGRALWTPLQGYQDVIPTPNSLTLADIDGDGKLDLVGTIANPNVVVVYYGWGDGSFEDPVPYPTATAKLRIKVADINQDGKLDFVVIDGASVSIMYNLGSRKFGAEQSYLAGTTVGELVVADLNGDGLPDIVVSNGSTNGGSTVTVLLNQPGQRAVQGTLAVTPEPSVYSQSFTETLTVVPMGIGTGTPSGTVVFSVDGAWMATVPVVNGTATYSGSPLFSEGMHSFSATYSGDANFLAAEFSLQHKVIPLVLPTSVNLVASTVLSQASTTIRFTATVTASGKTPDGYVGFSDGTTTVGSAQLDTSGRADFETSLLSAGIHNITANYLGTAHFGVSKSNPVTVTITAIPTSTALSAPSGSIQPGMLVQVSTTVTSSAGTPFGSVTIYDGSIALQTVSLTSGASTANLVLLTTGSHTLTAKYRANGKYDSSTSSAIVLSVSAGSGIIPSATAISAEHYDSSTIKLSATVNANDGTPSGYITFLDGSTPIGQAMLSSGSATQLLTDVAPGAHTFQAVYVGDDRHAFSVSPALVESETAANTPDYTISLPSRFLTLTKQSTASVDISVAGVNGFSAPVSLTCSSATGVLCTLTPSEVAGTGNARLSISYAGTLKSRTSTTRHIVPAMLIGFFGFPGLLLTKAGKKSRVHTVAGILCLLCVGLAGCGIRSDSGQSTLTTVSVFASSGGTGLTLTHSVQITVRLEATGHVF